jgi:hypothetical protein
MGGMTVPICIMVMVYFQVLMMMGIKSVMKTQRTILSRKMMMMRDDCMQDQQQICWKQT